MTLKILGGAGAMITAGFWLVAAALAPRLRKSASAEVARRSALQQPSVTLFKPLCGADPHLAENLRSFCRQEYPHYRIVMGIADENDPALRVARQMQAEFSATADRPALEIQIVTGAPLPSANAKVANLVNMAKKVEGTGRDARATIWIVSDSDVRVGKDWLQRMVAAFADEKVGVASCFYRMADPPNLPAAMEAFQVNTDFLAGILISERFFTLRFALGATMAVRKSVLDQLGGFEALADFLADDYQLGFQANRAGYRVVMADEVVDIVQEPITWGAMWAHQLRWSRTYRVCEPVGYFFSILADGMLGPVLLGFVGLALASWTWMALALVTVGIRLASAQRLYSHLTERKAVWKYLWLGPVRDGLKVILWLAAFTGQTVTWREKKFTIGADGRMKEILHR